MQLAARWSLTLEPRFPPTPGSPGNFVAPARRADGTEVVLKVSGYVSETRNEIEALFPVDARDESGRLSVPPRVTIAEHGGAIAAARGQEE